MFKKKADAILDIGSEYMRLVVLNKSGKEAVISHTPTYVFDFRRRIPCPDEIYPYETADRSIYLRFKTRIKTVVTILKFICTVDKNIEGYNNFVKQRILTKFSYRQHLSQPQQF